MFIKSNKSNNIENTPKVPANPTYISSDIIITGDIKSEGEVQIDGSITGNIFADTLTVGKTANINGEINAEVVYIHGKVIGEINAKSVALAKTAHIQGDILHGNLSIDQGAFLEGHCRRMDVEKKQTDGTLKLLVKGVSKDKTINKIDRKPLTENN